MTPRAGMLIAAGALVAGTVTVLQPAPADAGEPTPRPLPRLAWSDCTTKAYPTLQCATLKVPLNHDDPAGRKITLALTRVPHTAKAFQGPLLVNPGGPGGSGRGMAGYVAASLPPKVAAEYDVIGFDPRGVGKSEPALDCEPGHFAPVRPDSVPTGAAAERAAVSRAQSFAEACGKKYADVLPYIDTVSTARDLDAIRQALGAPKINYLGYSYGTYLGAVYARLYPDRVRRMALDSVVNPHGVWYEDNIAQDYAFDNRHKDFMAWVAKQNAVYELGTDPAAVEAAWYRMRDALRTTPAGGKVGPAELEDTFLPGGYYNGYWPRLASAFAAYVNDADPVPLKEAYERYGEADAAADNGYSVYTSVQCRDAAWPRDWNVWRKDNWDVHAKAPFSTWNNAWYNAPCAFWPVDSLTPPDLTNDQVPPVLVFQATDDAATPYEGGVALHRLMRGSSLVVEEGGGNHGITLGGNDCLDEHLAAYLATGKVPRGEGDTEVDAVCAALPEPEPEPVTAAAPTAPEKAGKRAGAVRAERAGVALHGLLGHVR
ncbi:MULTISPECIES: alpha/beta hydrolase [Streptomyces]|uniref:Pimeloyl-ACP methyl ester carboxylesterase n=1 Tax=Streptomyces nymphaeiformis TaxID=2663842 RepID=A0A7W7U435_9ACTN|nr:alpha/beta hydrolase [Streptomyces nymphaeiformis]MBB4984523.1 pimeloyl-ACP methyl ester carboxylesterase [Streptomyces nymphaeiformis]